MTVVVVSFLACLAGFAAIGLASARRRQRTAEDYLIAGRAVSPWLTALSSAATNNSGFMFIGLFGFAYRYGVQAVWLQAGWVVGDVIAWWWCHRRIRERGGDLRLTSLPQLVAAEDDGRIRRALVTAAAALTFLFLGGYAAAQLKAGSTALTGLFGWDPAIGVVLGTVIVVAYCFAGGLRASIWTDAAQAIVMLASLSVLLGLAAAEIGGPGALGDALAAADPALVQWIPDDLAFGFGLYALGFVCGGLGVLGQPHILIRTMALRSPADIPRTRAIYFLWYVPFSVAAVAAALYGRAAVPDLLVGVEPGDAAVAAEAALPALATHALPPVLLGVLLAAVFAATMSTADSQILACSAAITQDLAPRWRASYLASKVATVAVAALALGIALGADQGVFRLVLAAWSALGAALGPIVVLRIARRPVPPGVGLAMMAAGLATVLAWARGPWAGDVFELLPGFAAPLAVYAAWAGARRITAARPRRA